MGTRRGLQILRTAPAPYVASSIRISRTARDRGMEAAHGTRREKTTNCLEGRDDIVYSARAKEKLDLSVECDFRVW